MNNNLLKKDNVIHLAFVLIEAFLLVVILFLPWNDTAFSFSAVALAFLHTALYFFGKSKGIFILLAMFFTLVSDVFLVILFTNNTNPLYQSLGMSSFSVAQIMYFLYLFLSTEKKRARIIHLVIRAVVSIAIVVVTILVLGKTANYLAVISMFYYANLLLNVVFAFVLGKKHLLFAIGLLLFAFCDVFVGLKAAVGTFIFVPETSFIYALANPSFNVAWTFYVPSQTIISLSIALKAKKGS